MRTIALFIVVFFLFSASALAQVSPVQFSILPNGRAGLVNQPVTYFTTIVNSGNESLDCTPRFGGFLGGVPAGVTAQMELMAWDGSNFTSAPNATVTIPAGGRQDYIAAITVDSEYAGLLIPNIRCTNAGGSNFDTPRYPGTTDFQISVMNSAAPDILLVSDTLTNDGVARVGATGPRSLLMTAAAINIGEAATNLVVEPEIRNFSLLNRNMTVLVCETDAAGACLGPQRPSLPIASWEANETKLFAVRVRVPAEMGVPFYPDLLRLRLTIGNAIPAGDAPQAFTDAPSARPQAYQAPGVFITEIAMGAMPIAGVDASIPYGSYQCATRSTGDTTAMSLNTGGVLVSGRRTRASTQQRDAPNEDEVFFQGFVTINDFDLQPFNQPVQFDYRQAGPLSLTVLGTGTPRQAVGDMTIPVNPTLTAERGLFYDWTGTAGFENDFLDNGRTRCAPVPSQLSRPRDEDGVAPASGSYDASPDVGESSTVTVEDPDEDDQDAGVFVDGFMERDPSENVASILWNAAIFFQASADGPDFDAANAVTDGDRIGTFVPVRFGPSMLGNPVAYCGVLILSGIPETEANPATEDQDAGVHRLVRQGVTLSDDDLADCVP
ncbi:hypothetical protein [Hyphobacterium sp.]|uniref:hypothetical protein n=1 Tax=Hyphobacterium sp. TaxID=2004662 RepID=UPI003BABBB25